MSVGFSAGSLGDILATAQLIVEIAQLVYSNRSVSEDCETLAIELQSLHGTLLVLNGALERCRSTPLGEPLVRFIQPEVVQCHRSLAKFSKQLDTFRLTLSSTSFASLWRKLVWVGSAEAASLSAILSSHRLKLVLLLISLNSVGSITCLGEVGGHIHREPRLTIHIKEKIIGIVHPLGVTIPVPTWACTTWESTHYLISNYSRNRIGQRYIERGDYQIVRPESDTIVDHSKFAKDVREGETVEICVITRSERTLKEDERRCPICRHLNTTALPEGGWMNCDHCCGRFQVNNSMRIDSEETPIQPAPDTVTTCEEDVDLKNHAGKRGANSSTSPEEKAEPTTEETDTPSTSDDMTDLKYFRRIILEVHAFVMAAHVTVPHSVTEIDMSRSFEEIPLIPPSNGINLKELAKDTGDALEALQPFYEKGSKWYIAWGDNKEIVAQVAHYVVAIKDSIAASEHGHTIASEAIDAWKLVIKQEALSKEDQKTLEDYVQSNLVLVEKGHKLAEKAMNAFREVRRSLEDVLKKFGQSGDTSLNDKPQLRTDALEKFKESLSAYVKWWNELKMRHKTQKTRSEALSRHFNTVRQQGILDQWKTLLRDYAAYNEEIMKIEDQYYGVLFKKN